MEEMAVLQWCDQHLLKDGSRVTATVKRVVGVSGTSAELDFCQECDEEVTGPARRLLEAAKSRVKRASARPPKPSEEGGRADKVKCPLCPQSAWISTGSRIGHVNKVHVGKYVGDVDWIYPPEVAEVWACGCKLTFTKTHSRDRHASRHSTVMCALPSMDGPIPARHEQGDAGQQLPL